MVHITISCLIFLNVLLEIGNCEGFEFFLILGNIFTKCRIMGENVKYAAKSLHIIDKFKEETKSEYGPSILYFNIDNYSLSSEFNPQEHAEILQIFDVLKPDVILLNKLSLNDSPQLFNRTAPVILGTESHSLKGDPFKNSINSVHTLNSKNRSVGIIDLTIMSKIDQSSTSEDEIFSTKIEFVKSEALKLQNLGINIIIVISDGDFRLNEEIAKIKQLDIIIENSTNIWMKVQNQNSKVNIPKRQECDSIKYLEKLKIESDAEGVVQKFQKESIFLDNEVPSTKESPSIFRPILREERSEKSNKLVGTSIIELDGNCRTKECSFGNMVADAMCYHESKKKFSDSWTKFPIALVGDVFKANLPTQITKAAIDKAIPQKYTVAYMTWTGKELKEYLEVFMRDRFWVQMSGIHCYYHKEGKEIDMRLMVRCGNCDEPMYKKLEETENYNIMLGRFNPIRSHNKTKIGRPLQELVLEYIKEHTFTYYHAEDRYLEVSASQLSNMDRSSSPKLIVQVTLYFTCFVITLKLN